MSTLPNKRKRRLKTESFDNPEKMSARMSESSMTNHEDLPGNKWKRRLHSLRRSFSMRKATNLKEFQVEQDDIQELSLDNKEPALADITIIDNRCENSKLNGLYQQTNDEKHSPYLNGYSSRDPYISDSRKTNVMKRKGCHRRTKGDSVRSNKYSSSHQHMKNEKSLEIQDSEIKQRRNRRSKKSLFSSWLKLPRKSTSDKNLKRQGLSVSTGNVDEQENNFKLLTDVRLVRDPGYISSSGESIDLGVGKYNSLRRSRASLIDIKWHKQAKSEGKLVSPTSRNQTLGRLSPLQKSTKQQVLLSRKITPTTRSKASVRRNENRHSSPVKIEIPSSTWENWEPAERSNSLGSFGNTSEDDDVYLTAEEDSRKGSPNLVDEPSAESSDQVIPGSNKENQAKKETPETELSESTKVSKDSNLSGTPNTKSISLVNIPIDDVNGDLQQVTQAKSVSPEVVASETNTFSKRQNLQEVQPGFKANIGSKPVAYVCKTCESQASTRKSRWSKDFRKFSLGQLTEFDDTTVVSMRCLQCKSPTLSKENEACHDLMITRPPKKPAPKPPALMKNKSKSLTTLAGKFPVLSEQLDVNESSSLHKLNDSCSDHLCELLSQTKDVSPNSEGVYVGIIGDQGVILRKRKVQQKQKRVVSMPPESLENVVEVEGTDVTNCSNIEDSTSEISNEQTFPSAESEVYLSCTSIDPPSSDVFNSRSQKELCVRSVSISSIEVQDFISQKKMHARSVPCLAFNKHCVDGLKPLGDLDILEYSGFSSEAVSMPKDSISRKSSSTAQSMMSLTCYESGEDSDDTSDKVTGKPLMYAEALWDHVTMNEEELSFTAGQAIAVYDVDDPEWWFGLAGDQIGWFPAAFVRIPVSGDLLNKYQNSYRRKLKTSDGNSASENGIDICLSKEEIRTKIIEEIVTTEQDYVQNLKNIVEGYLKQAKKRPDMFDDKLLTILFSNVESIYCLHLDFLHSIEHQYHLQGSKSGIGEVGAVFVKNKQKFELYSEYCNNHPRASSQLKHLLQQDKYRYFFEACRMLQDMIKISLDGFLLTPVQKICKYPLQLQELLKYTKPEHTDYHNVQNALKAMREVASSINEKKRKVENIKKIAEWQLTIEEWEGEDVLIKSSQLVHSGEVMKLSKGKTQDVTLFLFDHQLVYCRKDLIKKRSLEYKGRIVLDNCEFEKLEDGEVTQNGVTVKNAWRLSKKQSNTSCLFQAKSSEQRDKWMGYFLQERKIVYETTSANSVPLEERVAAMDEAKNAAKSRKQIIKGEKKYGEFNTVSRAIRQLHYGSDPHRRKIDLPPPVSSAMLFQRDQPRSSFGILRNSGVFKKRRPRDLSDPK